MSHFYQDVLEQVLNGPMESLVKFLRLKGMLKQTVMCPEIVLIWSVSRILETRMVWRLGAITKSVMVTPSTIP